MSRFGRSLAMIVPIVAFWGAPVSASSYSGRALAECRSLQSACESYAAERGDFPATDSESTWGQKLVRGEFWFEGSSTSAPDEIALDPWGRPYELLVDRSARSVVVRSFGADGVDNRGLQDDISSDRDVNPGYYWKRYWPLIDVLNLCFGLGLVVFTVAALASPRRWRTLCMWLVLAYLGACIIIVSEVMFRSLGGHRIETVYHRLYLVGWLALAACAARGFAWVVWKFSANLAKQRRVAAGQCESCGYSLHGLDGRVCPECGERKSIDPADEGQVEGASRGVR